jgi:hypothetical protein
MISVIVQSSINLCNGEVDLRSFISDLNQSCPWVGFGWVRLGGVGSRFFSFLWVVGDVGDAILFSFISVNKKKQ